MPDSSRSDTAPLVHPGPPLPATQSSVDAFSISTIIPTVGRPELAKTVQSVLMQDASIPSEVVIVNDSGAPLPKTDWLASERVRVVSTGGCRTGQTAARNLGASHARHRFLHFLDDDDWMLPGAFAAFEAVQQAHPDARWLYGIVNRQRRDGTPLDPLPVDLEGDVLAAVVSGEWLPFQGALVRRDLFEQVGGFDPNYQVSEDVELQMRLALSAPVHRIRTPVCVYSVGEAMSATRRDLCTQYLYQAYEALFSRSDALDRLVASATTPHLRGRLLRLYLISMRNNAQSGTWGRAVARAVDVVRIAGQSLPMATHPDFRTAIRTDYAGRLPRRLAEPKT